MIYYSLLRPEIVAGITIEVEEAVERALEARNLLVEGKIDGRWAPIA